MCWAMIFTLMTKWHFKCRRCNQRATRSISASNRIHIEEVGLQPPWKTFQGSCKKNKTLFLDNEDGVTTLRLLWNPTDQLQVKNTTQVQPTPQRVHNKRVLGTTASTFDPLGLLSSVVNAYKIFLQKLWEDKLQWEELLPSHCKKNGTSCFRLFLNHHNSR